MSDEPWEKHLTDALGWEAWDEGTELVSMLADDAYPAVLSDEVRRQYALESVISLLTDEDYRRCIERLLEVVPAVDPQEELGG